MALYQLTGNYIAWDNAAQWTRVDAAVDCPGGSGPSVGLQPFNP